MFTYCRFLSLLLLCVNVYSQNIWEFSENKNRITIPFQLLNNTIIVQPKLNNVKLNLILDTGSAYNVLFAFPSKDSIAFYDTFKIKITGPGTEEPIDAYISRNNRIEFKNFTSKKLDVILMLEEKYDFSTNMGIPIHGILGADFFKNNKVEIQYDAKKIIVYRKETEVFKRKISSHIKLPFSLKDNKPYIPVEINIDDQKLKQLELLVDTGLSDGLWIFEKELQGINKSFIVDYLGSGIGGNIFGKRVRFKKIKFSEFEFDQPIISLPDTISFAKKNLLTTRDGSFGGEILKRFNVIFDYSKQLMYIKKNSNFKDRFYYNVAGIDIHHNGIEIIEEKNVDMKFTTINFTGNNLDENKYSVKYTVKPGVEIVYVRKNSIAEKAGLMVDDKIISVNGKKASNYKLQELSEIFHKNIDEIVTIQIERGGIMYTFELLLKEEI